MRRTQDSLCPGVSVTFLVFQKIGLMPSQRNMDEIGIVGSFKIFCKFVGCADVFVLVAEARVDVLHLRCAMAALRLGYEVFAIRQMGVCATSKDAHLYFRCLGQDPV